MSPPWIPPRRSYHLRVFACSFGLVVIGLGGLLLGVRMEAVEPAMRPIPAVGEHSATILAELGFDQATISRWKTEQLF